MALCQRNSLNAILVGFSPFLKYKGNISTAEGANIKALNIVEEKLGLNVVRSTSKSIQEMIELVKTP